MVTIEQEIQFDNKVDTKNVEIKHLKVNECIDSDSDIYTSFKLINQDGDVLLLLESMPLDLFKDDDIKGHKGCFIRRFEFYKKAPYEEFTKAFLTAVRYKMISCDNNHLIAYYSYLWLKLHKTDKYLINLLFNLKNKMDMGEYVLYYESFDN